MRPNFRMTFFSHSHQPYKISMPARAPAAELCLGAAYVPLIPLSSVLAAAQRRS